MSFFVAVEVSLSEKLGTSLTEALFRIKRETSLKHRRADTAHRPYGCTFWSSLFLYLGFWTHRLILHPLDVSQEDTSSWRAKCRSSCSLHAIDMVLRRREMLQISRRFVFSAKDASTCSREESFRCRGRWARATQRFTCTPRWLLRVNLHAHRKKVKIKYKFKDFV